MAGVTDRAFRSLCLRHGAGLTFSEMVSAKGLEYDGVRTFALVEPADEERVLAVQLFGSEPDCMARARPLVSPSVWAIGSRSST